jgi:hypothetical protein
MCIRVAALVYLTFGTPRILVNDLSIRKRIPIIISAILRNVSSAEKKAVYISLRNKSRIITVVKTYIASFVSLEVIRMLLLRSKHVRNMAEGTLSGRQKCRVCHL